MSTIVNNLKNFFNLKNKKFLVVAGIIVAFLALGFGYPRYEEWRGRRGVENLAKTLKQMEVDDYKSAMADTYGGKTPQETLQMYIDAVEKGDYELASKYFIGANQQKELESFRKASSSKEQINKYLLKLKSSINDGGNYGADGTYFSFKGNILINLKLYPNGIWKIIEI